MLYLKTAALENTGLSVDSWCSGRTAAKGDLEQVKASQFNENTAYEIMQSGRVSISRSTALGAKWMLNKAALSTFPIQLISFQYLSVSAFTRDDTKTS